MQTHIAIGKAAEQFIANYLQREGFCVLARNYRKRYGEIDLIAIRDDVVSFVEVKVRNSIYFDLTQLISPSKQRKIIAVAKEYIAQHAIDDKVCRFDVALLEHTQGTFDLCYIPNAFMDGDHG